jgi:hypothetical protein
MIPATDPHRAVFTDKDGILITTPVIAWSDDGEALVSTKNGTLTTARGLGGFLRVQTNEDDRVVAAIPGAGWQVRWKETGDCVPVVAWTFTAKGDVQPCVHDDDTVMEASLFAGDDSYEVVPPHE